MHFIYSSSPPPHPTFAKALVDSIYEWRGVGVGGKVINDATIKYHFSTRCAKWPSQQFDARGLGPAAIFSQKKGDEE